MDPVILILGGIWSFSAVFQIPEVAILQFKMLSEVDLWLQCIITIPEIPILGGIWSYAAVYRKPEVAILDLKMAFGDMPEEGRVSKHYGHVCYT